MNGTEDALLAGTHVFQRMRGWSAAEMNIVEFLSRLRSSAHLLEWRLVGREKRLRGFPKRRAQYSTLDPIRAVCFIVSGRTFAEGKEAAAASLIALSKTDFRDIIKAADNMTESTASEPDSRYRRWLRRRMVRSLSFQIDRTASPTRKSCLIQTLEYARFRPASEIERR
jgi:hypothetical protein